MNSSTKRFSLLALAVVMVAILAMQGATQLPARAAQATAAATEAPTATPKPAASVEGTLTVWIDKDRTDMATKLGAEFTKKYNVPVKIQQMGFGDIRNNLVLAAPAGEGPDLSLAAHDWLGQLVSNGLVAEMDLGDKLKSFDPVTIKAFTYDGKLYGLPYQSEAIALYYNKDLVPNAPKTWQEMVDIATKLKADGKVDLGIVVPQDPYHSFPIITGFGGYVFGQDKTTGAYDPKDVGLDSPGAIKGAQEIDKLVKAGVFKEGVGDAAKDLFIKGRLAFFISGPWNLNDIRKGGVNYAVSKIPPMDGVARPFVGVNGFVVNKFSKNLDLAKAFLTDFVATDEGMQLLYDAVPASSAWLPVKSKIKDADLANFGASAGDGLPMPAIPQMNAVWTAYGNAINLIYQQKGDPAQIMKDAAKAIRDEIAKTK